MTARDKMLEFMTAPRRPCPACGGRGVGKLVDVVLSGKERTTAAAPCQECAGTGGEGDAKRLGEMIKAFVPEEEP